MSGENIKYALLDCLHTQTHKSLPRETHWYPINSIYIYTYCFHYSIKYNMIKCPHLHRIKFEKEIIWKSVQCKWYHISTCSKIQKRVQYDLISSSGEWYFHSIGSVVGSKNSWWERAKSHWTLGKDCTLDAYNIRFTDSEQIISVIFKSSKIHEISHHEFLSFSNDMNRRLHPYHFRPTSNSISVHSHIL